MDYRIVTKGKTLVTFDQDGIMCFFTMKQWLEFQEKLGDHGLKITVTKEY